MEETKTEKKEKTKKDNNSTLVIWNDDVNTFDWVIVSLIEICQHTLEQAQQCATIAHRKGKCDVKSGSKDEMLKLKKQLNDRKIEATVE
jgi:ATP-dependent Clp protease adaptor protein ClpS